MLVKLPLIGDGSEGNGYRCEYPTYKTIEVDYENMVAIVDVPDYTLPRDFAPNVEPVTLAKGDIRLRVPLDPKTGKPGQERPQTHRDVVTSAHPREVAAWHDHLDDVYQEHAGKFRPLA